MSLDLLGVLPSNADLDAVEADPAALADLRDAMLEDPRLEDRLVSLLAERWHTRVDTFDIHHYDYDLPDEQEFAFERDVGEEPLRLMAHVVTTDRPWTDIVTADYTMSTDLLAGIWPLDYPTDVTGWQVATYTDGRPAVGVLATNGLWWRYTTSSFNLSRSRVAAAARLLTCYDMLERPISFAATPSLLDADGTATAIHTEDTCQACHSAIEPAAAAMFGFVPTSSVNVDEVETYHPEREPLGPALLGVTPAWFGTPIDGLAELGPAIAADPRFPGCAVQTFAAALWRREVDTADDARLDALRVAFVDGGMQVRPLLRDILAAPTWQAGGFDDAADDTTVARERTRRLLSPDVLTSAVEDLTGFRWTERGFDQLQNDEHGYRVLAGGVNGVNVLRPQEDPGLTWTITVRRLAEAAADTAFAGGVDGVALLDGVSDADRPGDPAFDAALAALAWHLYAERPTAEDLSAWEELWSAVEAEEGAEAAWTALLAAMLQDPAFVAD
jgi:hypothetical protein